MDKAELQQRIEESYAAIVQRMDALNDAAWLRPRRADGWAPRDIFAHLAAWYDVAAERLRLLNEGQTERIQWLNDRDVDILNARNFERAQGDAPDEVRRWLDRAHAGVLAALAALPDAALADPALRVPVERWLPVCTYEHDAEHLAEV